jgi:hypothetical protein
MTKNVAPDTDHDRVADCPGLMEAGLAVKDAMVGVELGSMV